MVGAEFSLLNHLPIYRRTARSSSCSLQSRRCNIRSDSVLVTCLRAAVPRRATYMISVKSPPLGTSPVARGLR